MGLSPALVLADAWASFRRNGELLLTLAGVFWFLPTFALILLVPGPPLIPGGLEPGSAAASAYVERLTDWAGGAGAWYLLRAAVAAWGEAALFALLLDRTAPDVGGALGRALALWPRFLLLEAVVGLLALGGLALWVLPGIWVLGRLLVAAPALVAERPLGALGAVGRSYRLSSGAGLPLMALVSFTLALGWVVPQPFLSLDAWLRARPGGPNVVAVTTVDALAALGETAAALASALLAVAAYRRLLAR